MDSRDGASLTEQAAARLRLVEEHVRFENRHDLRGIMATFGDEAKYEDAPWGEHHLGRGLPATGRRVRFPLCAIYRFTPDGKLASETIYYDRAGVLRQVGLYHEPVGVFGRLVTALTHPLTLARAYLRKLFRRSAA